MKGAGKNSLTGTEPIKLPLFELHGMVNKNAGCWKIGARPKPLPPAHVPTTLTVTVALPVRPPLSVARITNDDGVADVKKGTVVLTFPDWSIVKEEDDIEYLIVPPSGSVAYNTSPRYHTLHTVS